MAVVGIAAVGAAAITTPASAAPAGLQTLAFAPTSVEQPDVVLVGRRDKHDWNYRINGLNLDYGFGSGLFPFVGSYRYQDSYYDHDASYLHCHGKRYWRNGIRRCTGRWHRHYYH
jgi:hypothetical protein